jgi:hypothetical protein
MLHQQARNPPDLAELGVSVSPHERRVAGGLEVGPLHLGPPGPDFSPRTGKGGVQPCPSGRPARITGPGEKSRLGLPHCPLFPVTCGQHSGHRTSDPRLSYTHSLAISRGATSRGGYTIWATGRKKVKVGVSRTPGSPRAAGGRCRMACGLRALQVGRTGVTLNFTPGWTCVWRYHT